MAIAGITKANYACLDSNRPRQAGAVRRQVVRSEFVDVVAEAPALPPAVCPKRVGSNAIPLRDA
jgi:hypothetical protein